MYKSRFEPGYTYTTCTLGVEGAIPTALFKHCLSTIGTLALKPQTRRRNKPGVIVRRGGGGKFVIKGKKLYLKKSEWLGEKSALTPQSENNM